MFFVARFFEELLFADLISVSIIPLFRRCASTGAGFGMEAAVELVDFARSFDSSSCGLKVSLIANR